jgi:hypothetical protein
MIDRLVTPLSQFGQGILGGGINVADQAKALVQAPFALNGKQDYQNWQEEYAKQLPPGTAQALPYQAGKMAGEIGAYGLGALGAGMALPELGAGAATLGTAALGSAAQSAQTQLGREGKVNPAELAGETALGTGLAFAGGKLAQGAGKLFGQVMKSREVENAIKQMAEKDAKRAIMLENIQDQLDAEHAENLGRLTGALQKPAAESMLQNAQQQALAAEDAIKGPFRLRRRATGFGVIDYATPLKDIQDKVSKETYKELKGAVNALGESLSLSKHLKNDLEAYAQNALSLAKTATQKAKVVVEETERLASGAADVLAEKKSELYLQQQQATKEATQALRDQLASRAATATKKLKAELREQISQLDEALQKLNLPSEIFNIPQGKHLYGIANRAALESPLVPRDLAKTFKPAYEQFVKATNDFKAAEKQWKTLEKHYIPLFEKAQKEFQALVGDDESRLWIKHPITNPFSRKVTTDMAIGLQHDPHIVRLNAVFQEEYKAVEAELRAQENNVVKEIAYKVGGLEKLINQTGKQATETLKQMGALHPVAEKIGLATALGLASLDLPSQASSGREKETHFFGMVGATMLGAIVAAKYGPAAARRLFNSPSYYTSRLYGNTLDLAKMADNALGINRVAMPGASLAENIEKLGGKVIEAIQLSPDDPEYFMRSLTKDVQGALLSPQGAQYAKEIRDMSKAFRLHATAYGKAWKSHYQSLSQADQDHLAPVNDAISFVKDAFGKAPPQNMVNRFVGQLFGNAASAWFSAHPKHMMANFFDVALAGPQQVGPAATARAYGKYASNPVLRGLVDKLIVGGARSQAASQITGQTKNIPMESLSSRLMALASSFHYFHTNPRQMQALGVATENEFTERLLSGKLPAETLADAYSKMYVDLAETLGADPTHLVRGPMGRSLAGNWLQFVSQPERFARLMATNAAKGNIGRIAASLGMLHQLGGKAVLPAGAVALGYAVDPVDTAKLIGFINMASVGQRTLGDMSRNVDWDPFLYPAMGVQAPGFEQLLDLVRDTPKYVEQIGQVIDAAVNQPSLFTASKLNEKADKVQTATRNLLNLLSMKYPTVGPIPLQAVSAFLYNLSGVMHKEHKMSIPRPGIGGGAFPLEAAAVMHGKGAQEAALRAMFRLPEPAESVGLYKTTEQGIKLGEKAGQKVGDLRKIQNKTGIR